MLIPKVTLRLKNEVSMQSTLPFRIENGKFVVRHESLDLNRSMVDESKFHRMEEEVLGEVRAEPKKEIKRVARRGSKASKDPRTALEYIGEVLNNPRKRRLDRHEFSYLEVHQHPYDLHLVNFQELESNHLRSKGSSLKEFITISRKGITFFSKDESTFISLEEWTREAKLFNSLIKLSYFRQYKIWKNFSIWRKFIRLNHMRKVR